jgi:predicted peptidase
VKFADDNRRTGRHKSDNVTQDFGWTVSVVQNHRDQRRARLHVIGLQRGCVCSDSLNVSYPTLLLATLELR